MNPGGAHKPLLRGARFQRPRPARRDAPDEAAGEEHQRPIHTPGSLLIQLIIGLIVNLIDLSEIY